MKNITFVIAKYIIKRPTELICTLVVPWNELSWHPGILSSFACIYLYYEILSQAPSVDDRLSFMLEILTCIESLYIKRHKTRVII